MIIKIKKSGFLFFNKYKIKCSIGKAGIKANKVEGDGATPKGKFGFGNLYYRKDRIKKINTILKKQIIKKNMGWCHNIKSKNYNRQVKFTSHQNAEKLFRRDHKYDLLLVIKYNMNPIINGKGSAIFLHLTKNYKATKGCIAVKDEDFLKIIKYLNKKSKIQIY